MDWAAIKREYITTGISQRALAKKYEVSLTAIRRRSVKEGWVKARIQTSDKATAKIVEKASDLTAEGEKILREAALEMARRLLGLAKNFEPSSNLKAKDITGALRDCREILDIRSEKDLKEQDARIAKLEREAAQENDTKSVTVRIKGAGDGWQN
jgi:hypothetical protein